MNGGGWEYSPPAFPLRMTKIICSLPLGMGIHASLEGGGEVALVVISA